MAESTQATLILKIKSTGQKALSGIRQGLSKIAGVAKLASAAIVGFVAASLVKFREQELAVNKLNQSMVQQGIYSKELSKEYQSMASELQKVTTFGDEATIAAISQLQAYLGQKKVTKELTAATQDFAAGMGIDLKNAADLIGKTLSSSTNALTRYGIEIDVNATKQEKMAQITKALNARFGGQAEAAADGMGAVIQLKNAFGDFMEVVGAKIAPLIVMVSQKLTSLTESIQKPGPALRTITGAFKIFGKTAVIVKAILTGLGQYIGTTLASYVNGLAQLVQGNFKKAWKSMALGVEENTKNMVETYRTAQEEMQQIDDMFSARKEQNRVKEEELLRASNERKRAIQEEHRALEEEQTLAANERRKALEEENRELKLEELAIRNEEDLIREEAHQQLIQGQYARHLKKLSKIEKDHTKSFEKRMAASRKKQEIIRAKEYEVRKKQMTDMQKFESMMQSEKARQLRGHLGVIAGMQQSHNKYLVEIGRAAALAQATMSIALGIARAWAFPFIGPALAAVVAAAGAVQLATIAGVKLAEGGIVPATVGGTNAVIGEGGRDEAVIPLEESDNMVGNNINITVNGGLMGDEASAVEFARAIDQKLLELRQNNESVSFDSGVV